MFADFLKGLTPEEAALMEPDGKVRTTGHQGEWESTMRIVGGFAMLAAAVAPVTVVGGVIVVSWFVRMAVSR